MYVSFDFIKMLLLQIYGLFFIVLLLLGVNKDKR